MPLIFYCPIKNQRQDQCEQCPAQEQCAATVIHGTWSLRSTSLQWFVLTYWFGQTNDQRLHACHAYFSGRQMSTEDDRVRQAHREVATAAHSSPSHYTDGVLFQTNGQLCFHCTKVMMYVVVFRVYNRGTPWRLGTDWTTKIWSTVHPLPWHYYRFPFFLARINRTPTLVNFLFLGPILFISM